MRKLHPGARWLFRLSAVLLLIIPGVILSVILSSIFEDGLAVLVFIIFAILFIFGIAEVYARMAYNRWLYDLEKDGIKIERGIIWKKYSTIPYERVQNVDIHRGVIARIFGFSTLRIQTAGYSGITMAEGKLPALATNDAEQIREYLMKRIAKRK